MTTAPTKKKELNSGSMGTVKYIKPFLPNDDPVIRKTDTEGHANYYRHNSEDELRTVDEELDTVLMCLLEPIQTIEAALSNSDNMVFANSLTAARQSIANTIFEMFRFIEHDIGIINVTRVYELEVSSRLRWGQCVGVKLKSPVENDEAGPMFDHDPELIDELKEIPPDKTEQIKTMARHIKAGREVRFQILHDGRFF